MRGRTHRGEKKASKTPALLSRSKRFHTLRKKSPPANVLDGEEMKRFEEAPIVLGLPSTPRQEGAKHRKRMRPIVPSILVDIDPGL
jgi:hypothetical protein